MGYTSPHNEISIQIAPVIRYNANGKILRGNKQIRVQCQSNKAHRGKGKKIAQSSNAYAENPVTTFNTAPSSLGAHDMLVAALGHHPTHTRRQKNYPDS